MYNKYIHTHKDTYIIYIYIVKLPQFWLRSPVPVMTWMHIHSYVRCLGSPRGGQWWGIWAIEEKALGACAVTWLARTPLTLVAELPGDVWKDRGGRGQGEPDKGLLLPGEDTGRLGVGTHPKWRKEVRGPLKDQRMRRGQIFGAFFQRLIRVLTMPRSMLTRFDFYGEFVPARIGLC